MTRALWIAVALAACGKKSEPPKKHDGSIATPVAIDAALVVDGSAADVEPTLAPPPPTFGKGRGDCKPDYAPRPTRDPNPMCKVAGGTFTMGANDAAFPAIGPAHKVRVRPFRIDRFEVTVAQVVFYLNTVKTNRCPGAREDQCFRIGGYPELLREKDGVFYPGPDADRLPVTVARTQGAERYCAWAGKRMPTSAEWEYAARHDPQSGKDLLYPWGDRFEKNRTNCDDEDCADGFHPLAPVGSFNGSGGRGDDSSPFGLHDMVGNADEMTATCFAPYKPCATACDDAPIAAGDPCKRVSRSQSFAARKNTLATWFRTEDAVRQGGFRCAIDDAP